jgi:starch synthase
MKILYIAAECSPFVKVGGLADVIGSLPQALKKKKKVDIRVILPNYSQIPKQYKDMQKHIKSFYITLGERKREFVGLYSLVYDRIHYYFIDSPRYFKNRSTVYNQTDDAIRFSYFQKAAIESFKYLDYSFDVLHVHDWHTAMIPLLCKTEYSMYRHIKSVFTIHNLAYQGIFPIDYYQYFNMEFDYRFEFDGYLNFMKTGIAASDFVTTVSPTYAKEIMTDYFGYGLQRLLKLRESTVVGVLNGLPEPEFNPSTDHYLAQKYSVSTYKEGKLANKVALYDKLAAPFDTQPMLVSMITRLVSQKGLDLIKRVFDELIAKENIKFVVIGDGDVEYVSYFKDLQSRYPDKIAAFFGYSNELAHLTYAASDLFLMPSKFEPCGLGQLIALKYGALPLVRETGGLKDSVNAYNEFDKTGNGFSFTHYNAHDMMHVLHYANTVYQNDTFNWDMLVERAMNADFSWVKSAGQYVDIYQSLLKKKRM